MEQFVWDLFCSGIELLQQIITCDCVLPLEMSEVISTWRWKRWNIEHIENANFASKPLETIVIMKIRNMMISATDSLRIYNCDGAGKSVQKM